MFKLEISTEPRLDRETVKQDFLLAIQNNFSLRSVTSIVFDDDSDIYESDLFQSAEDKQSLAFYANRNECLDQWVDNPKTVKQQKVWPDGLALAEKAGPNSLFRGLRSILGSDSTSLPSGRKRKRPQYYAP